MMKLAEIIARLQILPLDADVMELGKATLFGMARLATQ
jgi:hypothetical protein